MMASCFNSLRRCSCIRAISLVAALAVVAITRADTTGAAGSSTAFNNAQPTAALTWMICVTGLYPNQGGPSANEEAILGEIRLLSYDGSSNTQGWLPCNGQTLAVAQNQALFSLLSSTYGGNGTSTFQLPDLRGRVPVGVGSGSGLTTRVLGEKGGTETTTLTTGNLPSHVHTYSGGTTGVAGSGTPLNNMQPYLVLNFCVEYGGVWDNVGWVRIFAFSYAPSGMFACNGSVLAIQQYAALFSRLGTSYGGNGTTSFALPDLRGRTPVGEGMDNGTQYTVGAVAGSETIQLTTSVMPAHAHSYAGGTTDPAGGGQAHSTMQPYLVLHSLVSPVGGFQYLDADPGVGEVRLFAGSIAQLTTDGWLNCGGQLLNIAEYDTLYALLGTMYGGDGQDTFSVPQLAGRALAHFGQGSSLTNRMPGDSWGAGTVTLTTSNLALHTHAYGSVAAPAVTGVSPTSGTTAGGTTVTISGTDFSNATAVRFGGTTATSFTVDSATQITATSPAHAAGAVDVTVITAGGTSATGSSDQFTYVTPDTTAPTITSIVRQTPSAQTSSNGTTSFTFRVTYSEAVQNVTTAQFSIEAVNAGTVAGTVASVSGTGTTRDVTVTVSSGSGEFRLKPVN
jgi:microcystin-dependent protein